MSESLKNADKIYFYVFMFFNVFYLKKSFFFNFNRTFFVTFAKLFSVLNFSGAIERFTAYLQKTFNRFFFYL